MNALPEELAAPAWEWGALAAGLIVGSFANVLIHRLPLRESVVWPRSRCPACGARIASLDNIPVLSYLALRGRCRSCRARISPRYPAVEIANGLMYLAVAAILGPTPRALCTMIFVTALLVLSLIDLEHYLLPDVITLPGIVLGLGASLLGDPAGPRPLAALGGAAAGYFGFFAVAEGFRRLRGIEGLGQGDWKMAAMLGAFFGCWKMLLAVFLATLAGTVVGLGLMALRGRTSKHMLPLGTFLGLGGLAAVFAGDRILLWYRGLLGV